MFKFPLYYNHQLHRNYQHGNPCGKWLQDARRTVAALLCSHCSYSIDCQTTRVKGWLWGEDSNSKRMLHIYPRAAWVFAESCIWMELAMHRKLMTLWLEIHCRIHPYRTRKLRSTEAYKARRVFLQSLCNWVTQKNWQFFVFVREASCQINHQTATNGT